MVDEIEIKNVGGFEGVASEATLLKLIAAVEKKNGAGSGSNIQDVYTKSVKSAAAGNNIFVKGIKGAAATVGSFAKELMFGGTRVTDFSSAIFGANSSITKLTSYIDRNVDTWRDLSSVGASFNNSIFDMIAASANSGMSLDQFSALVQRNSIALASFGGTATQGAKQFGDFSKNFRRGIGQQFFEMGFTIADVNDGLIGFFELQRRSTSQTLRFDKTQQASAANYILQLDKLSKITGLQRKELESAMQAQLQDAGVRSQLNRLSGTAQDNLRNTLAFLDTELQGPLADGLKDLMDGVAQTDIGKALQSQLPGIGEFAQKMFAGGASMDEVISQLSENFGPQLEGMSNQFSKAQLDQMRMQGGMSGAIAEMMDSAYQLNRLKGRNNAAARKEQEQRDLLTSTFGKFEQSIIDLRAYLVDTFFEIGGQSGGILDAFKNLGTTIMGLISPAGGAVTGFGTTIETITTSLFGPDGVFTNAINLISTQLSEFATLVEEGGFLKAFETKLNELSDWISKWFKEIFFGKDVESRDRQGTEHQKGLFAQAMDGMVSAFESFWEGPYGQKISDTVAGYFESLIHLMEDTFVNSWLARSILGIDRQEVASRQANNTGPTNESEAENFGRTVIEKLQSNIATGNSSSFTSDQYSRLIDSMGADTYSRFQAQMESNKDMMDWARPEKLEAGVEIGQLANMAAAGTASQEQLDLLREVYRAMEVSGMFTETRSIGTLGATGLTLEPKDTVAQIHQGERVLNPAETAAYNSGGNQSQMTNKLDQLNTTMLRVASLLEAGLGVQTRTMKGVRAQSGDLFRSLGR
tara:strand:+ start:1766 stop:4195 length:2430 start_codon:yes stop_codon:yes gene_type:complete